MHIHTISDLSLQIKAGLQKCSMIGNSNEPLEVKYKLFNFLAELYLLKAEIQDYPKVFAIYQYQHKLLNHLSSNVNRDHQYQQLDAKAVSIQKVLLKTLIKGDLTQETIDTNAAKITSYRTNLKRHRDKIQNQLEDIKDLGITQEEEELDDLGLNARNHAIKQIYHEIRQFFIGESREKKGMIQELIRDTFEELGNIPQIQRHNESSKRDIKYAIFGMGSIALGTMTPWSDLEFGILIESDLSEKDNYHIREYFRHFTILFHSKVIQFGETPLRMMGIEELNNFRLCDNLDPEHNWFFDKLTKSGFSFDGPHWHACKTPLGRKRGYRKRISNGIVQEKICTPYELIGTQADILRLFNENTFKEDPQLIQSLINTILIHGDQGGLVQFQQKLSEYKPLITSLGLGILNEDLQQLNPFKRIINEEKEGQILNVKTDIYRFPDRILVALSSYFGITGTDSWQIIQNMTIRMTSTIIEILHLSLGIAVEIRLRTYSHNQGQEEDLLTIARFESEIREPNHDELLQEIFQIKDLRLLYKYCYMTARLAIETPQITSNHSSDGKFSISLDSRLLKGDVYQRFLKYNEAISELENANSHGFRVQMTLGSLYDIIGEFAKALECKHLCLESILTNPNASQTDIAAIRNNIGNTLQKLGQDSEALQHYQRSLEIRRKIFGDNHTDIASSLTNIGNSLDNQAKYQEALRLHRKSLKINFKIYGESHYKIVDSLSNIGKTLQNDGKYELSLRYKQKAVEIAHKIYRGCHPRLGILLHNLSITLESLHRYEDAIRYRLEGLNVKSQIHQVGHPTLVNSSNMLATLYSRMGRYDEALVQFNTSLEISRKVCNDSVIATILNNVVVTLIILHRYSEALLKRDELLETASRAYPNNHPIIGTILSNFGECLGKLGRYDEALIEHQRSLNMRTQIYDHNHVDIGLSYLNLGNMFNALSRHKEAIEYTANQKCTRTTD